MTDRYIFSTSPFSLVKVAKQIAKVTGAKPILGAYNPHILKGKGIAIGNPDYLLKRIVNYTRNVEFTLYVTVEGVITGDVSWLKNYRVIAVSNYVKAKLEERDIYVEDVIPHGVEYYGEPKRYNNKLFGYISGYQKRKYPEYGVKAIQHTKIPFIYLTNSVNPYKTLGFMIPQAYQLDDIQINNFYRVISFYLNLSDSEGYGITPLEAMAFGNVVITADYPPINEHIPKNLSIMIPTYDVWYEGYMWEKIEHHVYKTEEMIEAIRKAFEMTDNQYHELSKKCIEYAK